MDSIKPSLPAYLKNNTRFSKPHKTAFVSPPYAGFNRHSVFYTRYWRVTVLIFTIVLHLLVGNDQTLEFPKFILSAFNNLKKTWIFYLALSTRPCIHPAHACCASVRLFLIVFDFTIVSLCSMPTTRGTGLIYWMCTPCKNNLFNAFSINAYRLVAFFSFLYYSTAFGVVYTEVLCRISRAKSSPPWRRRDISGV